MPSSPVMTLPQYMRLRGWRHAVEAAEYFDIDNSTICRWLRGEGRPSGDSLLKLVMRSGGLITLEDARKRLSPGDCDLGTDPTGSTP